VDKRTIGRDLDNGANAPELRAIPAEDSALQDADGANAPEWFQDDIDAAGAAKQAAKKLGHNIPPLGNVNICQQAEALH